MKHFAITVLGIVGAVAFTATSASAVCNEAGDCWHVKDKYDTSPNSVSTFMATVSDFLSEVPSLLKSRNDGAI
jgi:hypothetical protein